MRLKAIKTTAIQINKIVKKIDIYFTLLVYKIDASATNLRCNTKLVTHVICRDIIRTMNRLKLIGATIWWAEGSKSRRDKRWPKAVSYPIELTNTNPVMITLFIRYLIEVVGVPAEMLKLQLQVHENDNKGELEEYWSSVTGIPKERFNKTIVRPKGRKPEKTKGTCKIRCYSKEFYAKIQSDLNEVLTKV